MIAIRINALIFTQKGLIRTVATLPLFAPFFGLARLLAPAAVFPIARKNHTLTVALGLTGFAPAAGAAKTSLSRRARLSAFTAVLFINSEVETPLRAGAVVLGARPSDQGITTADIQHHRHDRCHRVGNAPMPTHQPPFLPGDPSFQMLADFSAC
jgi:hypothetical protein